MKWEDVRADYPDQWVVFEALHACSGPESIRHVDDVAVLHRCGDGGEAMAVYRRLHRDNPGKEFYFVHTSREDLDIEEHVWVGARGA